MSDRKLTQGTYYSCQHQKLASNECNTCKTEREREREREDDSPILTNSSFLPCQGNCGIRILVEIHSTPPSGSKWMETKYIIKEDCYHQGGNSYTCANCQEGKKSNPNQNQINQLQEEINQLEQISNRTPQQEQELQDKKKQLAQLEKQQPNKTNWTPWIIGGGVVIGILVIFIIYLLTRNKEKEI